MIFHARRVDLIRLRALGVAPATAVLLAIGEVGTLAVGALIVAAGLNFFLGAAVQRLAAPLLERIGSLPGRLFRGGRRGGWRWRRWRSCSSPCCRRCRCCAGSSASSPAKS